MNALKTHAFLRPSSRPSSPIPPPPPPAPGQPSRPDLDRVARPLNRLSLTNFRRPSPAPQNTTPTPPAAPLVQDGSYLEMLGLKLSEAVTKALAQSPGPSVVNELVAGRKPIPAGRGRTLGKLISSEVKATQENAHLSRAIMRSLQRPLSVLLTNLSTQLAPLLSSPAFNVLPTTQNPNSNATQLHVIGITTFAGELLETFDELGLGLDNDVRGDGLKPVRDNLVSLMTRGLTPLITAIRNELTPLIEALEVPMPATNGAGSKGTSGLKSTAQQHPSIVALQSIVPVYSRALARYTTTTYSQKQLATLLISVVWRGLVALSHRPSVVPTPPPSPGMNGVVTGKKRRGSPTMPTITPPLTPPSALFNIKLPPSRPPSPPAAAFTHPLAADVKTLYDVLNQLPRPFGESEAVRLAREAVDEAFDALKALAPFLNLSNTVLPFGEGGGLNGRLDESFKKQLEKATEDIPTLICLPCLLRGQSVASILGLPESEYRQGCLSGFGRAEECADAVGQRVLEVLLATKGAPTGVIHWLEAELVPSDDEEDA